MPKVPPPEHAFLEAFDEYADSLFRHASFRVSDRDRAADLVQETFLKTWDYVCGGGEIRHWKSFLYRILRNLIIDEYRRKKELSLDMMLDEGSDYSSTLLTTDSRAEREERFDDEESARNIRTLIQELPEHDREALTLRYIDGFSPQEIAATLNISKNAASVRIHRAALRLKKKYDTLIQIQT